MMPKRPSWISTNADGKDELRCDDPELTIQLARYGCEIGYRFPSDTKFPFSTPNNAVDARGLLIAGGTNQAEVRSLADWSTWTDVYPETALDKDDIRRGDNPDMPARAFYLRQAVSRLLELVDAPLAMKVDLSNLLDRFVSKGAEARARVQKTILENPSLSLQQVAKRADADCAQASKDGKNGLLFWPADAVGTASSGTQ